MKAFLPFLLTSPSLLLLLATSSTSTLKAQDLENHAGFDRRLDTAPATQSEAQIRAAERIRSRMPVIHVRFDPVLGTARAVLFRDGVLSAPITGYPAIADPHWPVKAFLDENRELFGGGSEMLNTTRVTREEIGMHDGVRTIVWSQSLDGVPVFQGMLVGHITRHGELLSLGNQLVPEPESASGLLVERRAALYRDPPVRDLDAVIISARHLGDIRKRLATR